MTEGKYYLTWPGAGDRIVVEEMLRDSESEQWHECYLFIMRLVHLRAKNISNDHWDDIVQDAMIRIHKYLSTFQYQCAFRTWLFGIVRSCIIDDYRKSKRERKYIAPLSDPHDDVEYEGDGFSMNTLGTVEDICITRDELDKALLALQQYVYIHANSRRNGRILYMVLFEDRSLEETAKAVGCSAPVVGYVVRSAQRYVRERLRHQQ
jgi:RNA polymerase sigma factor (sigma-70 family)